MSVRIHPTSEVSAKATIGEGTQIWLFCQVRDNARIGKGCIFGKGVYIDNDVVIGDNVKLQNNVSVYVGVTIEDGVFVGPHVCFTNDKVPRAVNADMTLKGADDWKVTPTRVRALMPPIGSFRALPTCTLAPFRSAGPSPPILVARS